MKCPLCKQNQSYNSGMNCSRCGYQFALDPKKDKIADGKFLSYIRSASCNGTFHYTENQLYTAACRKSGYGPPEWIAAFVLITAGIVVLCFVHPFGALPLFFGCIAMIACLRNYYFYCLPRETFENWLGIFQKKHRTALSYLISEPSLHKPPRSWKESDVYDYGVERVLLVQHDILVDLIVRNNLHAANRALVISSNDYPQYIKPLYEKVLSESGDLPVFLFHDATSEGTTWVKQMKQHELISNGSRNVIDMGLHLESLFGIRKIRRLRINRKNSFGEAADILPMAMLANGIGLAMEKGVSMQELLLESATTDSLSHFG